MIDELVTTMDGSPIRWGLLAVVTVCLFWQWLLLGLALLESRRRLPSVGPLLIATGAMLTLVATLSPEGGHLG